MCELEIELPDLPTQQKYVDVYNAMVANQQAYERGLEDLKLTCDALIDKVKHTAIKKQFANCWQKSIIETITEQPQMCRVSI